MNEKTNSVSGEQDAEILLLELSRLRKEGVIDFKTYERAKQMWRIY